MVEYLLEFPSTAIPSNQITVWCIYLFLIDNIISVKLIINPLYNTIRGVGVLFHSWTFMPKGRYVFILWMKVRSRDFLIWAVLSGSPGKMARILGMGWAPASLCLGRLKCFETMFLVVGVLFLMLARCSKNLTENGLFVSPIYCCPHCVQVRM